jgi:hypothetical protein
MRVVPSCIVIGTVGFTILLLGQAPPPSAVSLAGPGDSAVDRLQSSFAKIVTYEDPVWVWRGELVPERFTPKNRPTDLWPVNRTFVMPAAANPPADLATEVGKMLDAYHQTGGPRFEVRTSKLGLHIVPVLSHDEAGNLVAAKNVLDAYVTVVTEQRTAYRHLQALIDAIGIATGVTITGGAAFPDGWGYEFDPDRGKFSWGANSATGREALIDLLDRSATSFSWRLLCRTGQDASHDHTCLLDVPPIVVNVTDTTGKLKRTSLLFDRCGKCPPLPSSVIQQLPPKQ